MSQLLCSYASLIEFRFRYYISLVAQPKSRLINRHLHAVEVHQTWFLTCFFVLGVYRKNRKFCQSHLLT